MLKGVSTITRNKSLKEQAYDILKEMILTGKLEQGEIYNEKTIAEVLGVSRTPVREALLELSREGMVKFLPSKGIQVRKITEKQVREVFEIRRIIEGHVIQTIAKTLTSTEIKKIEAILKKQERLSLRNEDIAFIETDKEFHLFLASKMGNQQIRAILQNLRDQIHVMGIRAIKVGSRVEPGPDGAQAHLVGPEGRGWKKGCKGVDAASRYYGKNPYRNDGIGRSQ